MLHEVCMSFSLTLPSPHLTLPSPPFTFPSPPLTLSSPPLALSSPLTLLSSPSHSLPSHSPPSHSSPSHSPPLTLSSPPNRCAGVIASVANNSYCGVGVAFNAKISGMYIRTYVYVHVLNRGTVLLSTEGPPLLSLLKVSVSLTGMSLMHVRLRPFHT